MTLKNNKTWQKASQRGQYYEKNRSTKKIQVFSDKEGTGRYRESSMFCML